MSGVVISLLLPIWSQSARNFFGGKQTETFTQSSAPFYACFEHRRNLSLLLPFANTLATDLECCVLGV